MTAAPPAGERQLCTFAVGHLILGVDILDVQEVVRRRPIVAVPLAPAVLGGLLNLRGQIVTAIDLHQRLGLAPAPEGVSPLHVVVRTPRGPTSLLVDRVGDVATVDPSMWQAPVEAGSSGLAYDLLIGVYQLPDGLLLELAVESVAAPDLVLAGASTR